MKKWRIKEVEDGLGGKSFYIQKRICFLFWFTKDTAFNIRWCWNYVRKRQKEEEIKKKSNLKKSVHYYTVDRKEEKLKEIEKL